MWILRVNFAIRRDTAKLVDLMRFALLSIASMSGAKAAMVRLPSTIEHRPLELRGLPNLSAPFAMTKKTARPFSLIPIGRKLHMANNEAIQQSRMLSCENQE